VIKGRRSDWDGLPDSKSLFHSPEDCGLPIGNLTSQVFANFYMTPFDHYMKHALGLRYYGRYVDDLILVHSDKAVLLSLIPEISSFLSEKLGLTLHPDKVYLQHYSKGVKYLGCVIKPHRIYVADRTKGNFYRCVEKYNALAGGMSRADRVLLTGKFRSSINSYLGQFSHYSTYNIRRRELHRHLSPWWRNRINPKRWCRKIVLR